MAGNKLVDMMSASTKWWLWSWVATIFLSPILFVACLAALIEMLRCLGLGLPGDFLRDFARHANDPCAWPMVAAVGGYMAVTPTLLIGVPTALALGEHGLTSLSNYAFGGALGGLVGGIAMVARDLGWANDYPIAPKLEFALLGMSYGTLAMLVFRILSGSSNATSSRQTDGGHFESIDH